MPDRRKKLLMPTADDHGLAVFYRVHPCFFVFNRQTERPGIEAHQSVQKRDTSGRAKESPHSSCHGCVSFLSGGLRRVGAGKINLSPFLGASFKPGSGPLQLAGQAKQGGLIPGGAGKMNADGQVVRIPVKGDGHGRKPAEVGHLGKRHL